MMKTLASFMATPFGRIIRVIAGLALMAWGVLEVGGSNGYLIAVAGALPMLTGLLNVCLIGPLFGAPLKGSDAQAAQG